MNKASFFRVMLLAFTIISVITVSCSDDDSVPESKSSINELVFADPNFSILAAAITRANLSAALETGNPLTVFAPDNAAFGAAGITEAMINAMPVSRVDSILKYHVHSGFVTASDVPVSNTISTFLGTQLYASNNTNGVFFNGVGVKQANVSASNGVVHVINNVLIPPTKTIAQLAAGDTSFTFLVRAVERVGLTAAISGPGKYTVFAPTNNAFRAAGITNIDLVPLSTLDLVVKYHVLGTNVFASDLVNNATPTTIQGGKLRVSLPPAGVKIDGSVRPVSPISRANITATNGVIHEISLAMLP